MQGLCWYAVFGFHGSVHHGKTALLWSYLFKGNRVQSFVLCLDAMLSYASKPTRICSVFFSFLPWTEACRVWGIVLSFVLVFLISLNIVWSYFGEDLLGRPFRRRPCYCVNIPGCFRQKTKPSAFVKVVGSHLAAETYPLKSHGSSKSFVFHRTTQCFCNRLSFLTAGKSQVELMTLMTHDSVPINVLVNRDPAATYVIAGPPINGMQTSLIHLFLSSHGKSKCLLVGGSI